MDGKEVGVVSLELACPTALRSDSFISYSRSCVDNAWCMFIDASSAGLPDLVTPPFGDVF